MWWNSCADCEVQLLDVNAWLCPWCFSCAAKHFDIPISNTGKLTWEAISKEIREEALAPNTVKAYERGFL